MLFSLPQYFRLKGILKQLHGSLMVIAWLMAASVGVLMPRYMKKTWVGKQFMKKDLWFVVSFFTRIHRSTSSSL